MSTMSNDPKQNNSPSMSSTSSSAGEPPPPDLANASLPQGEQYKKEQLGEAEYEKLKNLQEQQSAMTADVEKQTGNTQNQNPTHEQTQNKDHENPER